MLVFANYQRTIMFQISSNQDLAPQISKPDSPYKRLYKNNCNISLSLQINNSLNFLTQSIQSMQTALKCGNATTCTNVITVIEDFVVSKKINYIYIASSQSRFVLPDLPIAVNLSKYEKGLCFLYQGRKASHGSFYEDE